MPSDVNGNEFSEFELEEIALGRGAEARLRLDAPARKRLADVRAEVDRFREVLEAVATDEGIETPSDETVARFLDGSLDDAAREKVERVLARSGEARRMLVALYRETRACEEGETIPESVERDTTPPEERVVPYSVDVVTRESFGSRDGRQLVGLVCAAVLIAVAFGAPVAWQIPAAFGGVVAAAMAAIHGALPVQSRTVARGWTVGLVMMALTGAALGVVNPAHLVAACSMTACALVLLYREAKSQDEMHKFSAAVTENRIADELPETRKRGIGGGK